MNFESKFLRIAEKLSQRHSTEYRGIPIVIEWPKNSVRTGKDEQGKPWKRTMQCDYGYVSDVNGRDGEGLDVYIGEDEASDKVFVIEQLDAKGKLDEYKIMLGFPNLDSALEMYLAHYPTGWDDDRVGDISEVPFDYAFDTIEAHQEEQGRTPKNSSTTVKTAGLTYLKALQSMTTVSFK
jgi:hypothetical protein